MTPNLLAYFEAMFLNRLVVTHFWVGGTLGRTILVTYCFVGRHQTNVENHCFEGFIDLMDQHRLVQLRLRKIVFVGFVS